MMHAFASLFIFNPFEIYIWCASSIYCVLVYIATRPEPRLQGLRIRGAVNQVKEKGGIVF